MNIIRKDIIMVDNSEDEYINETSNILNVSNIIAKDEENNDFIKLCNKFEEELTMNYRKQRDDIRNIKKLYLKEVKNMHKKKNKGVTNETAGINKPIILPNKLADLIGVNRGTSMPRTRVGSLVYNEFSQRGLLYEKDKRIMRVDNELKQIFNVSDRVNNSINVKDKVDEGINFYNLHSYIKRCYDENERMVAGLNISK